jgi:WD40 repeat protein
MNENANELVYCYTVGGRAAPPVRPAARMEFSDKLRHGGSGQPAPVAISPDGLTMATTHDLKVELREVDSLKVLQLYTSLDVVQHMVWSPDSKYLACGIYKRGLVQVRRARVLSRPLSSCRCRRKVRAELL